MSDVWLISNFAKLSRKILFLNVKDPTGCYNEAELTLSLTWPWVRLDSNSDSTLDLTSRVWLNSRLWLDLVYDFICIQTWPVVWLDLSSDLTCLLTWPIFWLDLSSDLTCQYELTCHLTWLVFWLDLNSDSMKSDLTYHLTWHRVWLDL